MRTTLLIITLVAITLWTAYLIRPTPDSAPTKQQTYIPPKTLSHPHFTTSNRTATQPITNRSPSFAPSPSIAPTPPSKSIIQNPPSTTTFQYNNIISPTPPKARQPQQQQRKIDPINNQRALNLYPTKDLINMIKAEKSNNAPLAKHLLLQRKNDYEMAIPLLLKITTRYCEAYPLEVPRNFHAKYGEVFRTLTSIGKDYPRLIIHALELLKSKNECTFHYGLRLVHSIRKAPELYLPLIVQHMKEMRFDSKVTDAHFRMISSLANRHRSNTENFKRIKNAITEIEQHRAQQFLQAETDLRNTNTSKWQEDKINKIIATAKLFSQLTTALDMLATNTDNMYKMGMHKGNKTRTEVFNSFGFLSKEQLADSPLKKGEIGLDQTQISYHSLIPHHMLYPPFENSEGISFSIAYYKNKNDIKHVITIGKKRSDGIYADAAFTPKEASTIINNLRLEQTTAIAANTHPNAQCIDNKGNLNLNSHEASCTIVIYTKKFTGELT